MKFIIKNYKISNIMTFIIFINLNIILHFFINIEEYFEKNKKLMYFF